jgi:hypothetical protein
MASVPHRLAAAAGICHLGFVVMVVGGSHCPFSLPQQPFFTCLFFMAPIVGQLWWCGFSISSFSFPLPMSDVCLYFFYWQEWGVNCRNLPPASTPFNTSTPFFL